MSLIIFANGDIQSSPIKEICFCVFTFPHKHKLMANQFPIQCIIMQNNQRALLPPHHSKPNSWQYTAQNKITVI